MDSLKVFQNYSASELDLGIPFTYKSLEVPWYAACRGLWGNLWANTPLCLTLKITRRGTVEGKLSLEIIWSKVCMQLLRKMLCLYLGSKSAFKIEHLVI